MKVFFFVAVTSIGWHLDYVGEITKEVISASSECLKNSAKREVLSLIAPRELEESLGRLKGKLVNVMLQKITPILRQAQAMLYDDNELIKLLRPALTTQELERLKNELWRGTLASIVYSWIRNPAVHGFGCLGVSFSNTTFQGHPVPAIGFQMLRNCLTRIARVARDRSLSTGKWFGHDFE